ncbi:UNVERIFIED_CONTAM: hypothetical protein Sindi_2291300 [Sesamum indicum]
MKIIEGLRDNTISFERSPLKYGSIPTSPSVPHDQRGKNISDVKLIRNITSPGLKDHEKIVHDWNIELKFGGKEAPDFKGNLVMKEKQTHLEAREMPFCLSLLSTGIQLWRTFQMKIEIKRNRGGWFPMHKILVLRINGDLQNKLYDMLRNSLLQFTNIPCVVAPEVIDQGIGCSVGLYEGTKGASREPTIIPERYITSSKAPKNVLLRDRFNATNSSPNIRVLRFSFSRARSRLFTISTDSKAGP